MSPRSAAVGLLAAAACVAPACKPDLDDRPSRITEARVIGVASEPAEAKPGSRVKYTLVWAAPDGSGPPPAAWAFCRTPKLPAEDEAVSPECARGAGVAPLAGQGASVEAETPADACELFGPEVPQGGYRPRDPDPTGGYYLPVRVATEWAAAFAFHRIRCNLAGAGADAAAAFATRYRANQNPHIGDVTAIDDGREVPWSALPAGRRVVLRASWDAAEQETYAYYDPRAEKVVDRRESLRLSWYASGGELELDRTGLGEGESRPSSENTFVAATGAGRVWVVLRDSRGGVSFVERPFGAR